MRRPGLPQKGKIRLQKMSSKIGRGRVWAVPYFGCSGFKSKEGVYHRVLQGAPPRGRQLYFTFPSAPDLLFEASKAPFLT